MVLGSNISIVRAQGNITIQGKVIDEHDNESIIGATITLKNTKSDSGVVTDVNGEFKLTVSSLPATIVVSYIGYKQEEIDIYEKPAGRITISLGESVNALGEVVIVSDGYQTQAKKVYTGSSTVISGASIENKPVSNPLAALQGEVAGLNISIPNNQPGANPTIRLRGLGSIGLSTNPLYVVDGMIITTGGLALSSINQDDIEDITVLKDASATSIYGSRGSNGVIVITTKRGKAGKTEVKLDIEAGSTHVIPFPDAGQPLNAGQYAELFIEGLVNAGNTQAQIDKLVEDYGINSGRSNDWQDLVYKTGKQQQYNVSIRGGNDKSKIFASAGYFTQEATILESDLRRISGLLNVEHKISNRVTFNAGINVSNLFQHVPEEGTGSWNNPVFASRILRPFQMAYNEDGTLNIDYTTPLGYTAHQNVLYIAENDKRTVNNTRARGNASIKWNIWDKLTYTSFISGDYSVGENKTFLNPLFGGARTTKGSNSTSYSRSFNWLTRNQLDYQYAIPGIDDFYVTAVLGYEAQRSETFSLSGSGTGFPLTQPDLIELSNAAVTTGASSSTAANSFTAIYSRLGANFKNKYSLNGSYRRDGSSVFGANNRYGNFWSIGGAWNIDEEDFFKNQPVLSLAKLHTSYGTTGNAQGITNYAARALAGYGSNYTTGNGQNYNTIGNPDLTWEKQKKFDVGVDLGFFHNRLIITPDYYINNIDGLIQAVSLSRTTGFSSVPYANSGAMENRGVELIIKGDILNSKKLSWISTFNIAFNHNEVTKLGNASGANGNYYLDKGYDYYTYYTRLYAGVDPANGQALWYKDGSKTETTTNYDSADRVPYKSATPKYFGGFNNTFNYKGIGLNIDFYYNFGNYVVDSWSTRFYDGAYYTFNSYQREYWNRWTTPGQVTDVPIYIAGGGTQSNSNSFSSRFLYDGSFIRLKNVALGYDFAKLRSLKPYLRTFSKLYVYGRASNLWTKTYDDRLPFDPESGNVSIPIYRTFTLGINVAF
ncbi:SusC/RagA family TonB-linked outer membrane protein [Bacteroidia bacterium]|nr:SusC/RagA family TonB-linked outer membrane protein [Bacteroidia bacterium]